MLATFALTGIIKYDSVAECFCSYCPQLDIYSAGNTRREAATAIQDAALLFIKHCSQDEILEEALLRRGLSMDEDNGIAVSTDKGPVPDYWQISDQGVSHAVRSLSPA